METEKIGKKAVEVSALRVTNVSYSRIGLLVADLQFPRLIHARNTIGVKTESVIDPA
jgi:hypothetical protein